MARDAATAALGFLRGFVGLQAAARVDRAQGSPSPDDARAALASRAERRASCC